MNPNPKPRKKYKKATVNQIQARVEEIASLIANGATRTKVHSILCQKYRLTWQTVDRYTRRAREWLMKQADKSRDEVRSDALSFYNGIINDPRARPIEKIKARIRIDEIFGIDAPRRIEASGPGGKPFKVQTSLPIDLNALSPADIVQIDELLSKAQPPGPPSRN